jgi:hypothetical protein
VLSVRKRHPAGTNFGMKLVLKAILIAPSRSRLVGLRPEILEVI